MSILTWIVLGLIVGFIANKLFNKTGENVFMNIVFRLPTEDTPDSIRPKDSRL